MPTSLAADALDVSVSEGALLLVIKASRKVACPTRIGIHIALQQRQLHLLVCESHMSSFPLQSLIIAQAQP